MDRAAALARVDVAARAADRGARAARRLLVRRGGARGRRIAGRGAAGRRPGDVRAQEARPDATVAEMSTVATDAAAGWRDRSWLGDRRDAGRRRRLCRRRRRRRSRPTALMATVRTLASEEYQGRAAGTEGGAKARAFVKDRFAAPAAVADRAVASSIRSRFTPKARASGARRGAAIAGRQHRRPLSGHRPGAAGHRALGPLRPPRHPRRPHATRARTTTPPAWRRCSRWRRSAWRSLSVTTSCSPPSTPRRAACREPPRSSSAPTGAEGSPGAGREPRHGGPRRQGRDLHRGYASLPDAAPLLEPVAARAPNRVRFGHDLPGSGHEDWTMQSDHGGFTRPVSRSCTSAWRTTPTITSRATPPTRSTPTSS